MADRRIEWQIALDSAGVTKGVKGIDAELSAMRKTFDSLQKIKAFDAQLSALNALASKLEAAKAKAAALAPAAQTGGKAAQNAYNKAAAEVDRLEKSLRSQTSAVAASAAGLEKAGISTRNLSAETARVAKEHQAAAAAAGQAAKVQQAWAATGVRSTKEIEAEIVKLQRLTRSGLLDQRGISAAEERIKSLNRELGRTPPAAREGEGALAGLTAGAKGLAAAYLSAEGAKKALTISAGFGDEMAAVKALTSGTAAEMEMLRAKAMSLAGAAGGPTAVAGAMAALATAGLNVNEIMFSVEAVRNMSAASRGLMSYAQAGDHLTDILKLSNLGIEKASWVTDRLIKSSISASQTLPEFIEGLKGILGYFTELYKNKGPEVALEKASAAVSALANMGTKGSKGGRILKNALTQLIAPSAKAADIMSKLSDEEQAETQSALGVIAAHKDMIRIFDDQGNFREFPDIIDDISKASLTAEEKMRLFGRIAGPAMFAWTNQGGESIREMEKKIHNADGTAKNVAETMQSELGGAFRLVRAEAEKAAIVISDPVDKALNTAIVSTRDFLYQNEELATVLGVTVGTFALYSSGAGTIATASALASTAIGGIVTAAASAAVIPAIITGTTLAVGYAVKSYLEMRDAQDMAAEATKREAAAQEKYQDRLKRASAETGLTLKSYKDVQEAYKSGKIDYDALTDTYSKGSGVARAAAEVHTAGAEAVGKAAASSKKSIKELDKENKILFENAKKKYEEYAKGIKEASGEITAIGLLPTRAGEEGLVNVKKALESLASTATITGAAMTKLWDDPADAIASYTPRLLDAADAEEAALRQSIKTLEGKNKALETQHKQVLYGGKLIIEQVGVQADASKAEQAALQSAIAGQKAKLNALMEVKSANGALIPGMQQVAGVWTNIGVAADRSNKQQLDGLQGLRLGMSSLADELFDLSLVGKNQEQVWKANQLAAAQYLQSAKELGAQAKREALKGNNEGAKELWAAEAAAIGKADALYKKLAVTVKTEWSPAMETAHKQSTESITKFGSAAGKALALARSGYDKVADAAQRSADAQQYFADKLRDVARESMTEAQAYEDIKRAAAEATAEAARLAKAGDWQGAQEQAKAAAEAWAQIPKEVKDGEQTLVSSAESAQVRADGIRQAAEISKAAYAAERKELEAAAAAAQRNAEIIIAAEQAIVAATAEKLAALKAGNASAAAAAEEEIAAAKARAEAAQKEVEAAAQKTGDSSGAQATQAQIDKINELVKANEEAAAKIKALEEEKGKVISEESENAKIAAEGVAAAQQQLVDAYDQQRSTLEGLASTEVAIMESVAKATTSASAKIKSAAAAAATELEKIKAGIDAIPANKEVTITVREVQARAGGGSIGTVTAMATGGLYARDARRGMHFPGFGGGDRWSNLVIAENGEYMQRKEATAALGGDGLALARAQNNLDFVRMQAILTKHLGPPQIKLDMPATRQQPMPQLGVIKLHVGDVQAEVYATPDNAAAIHAAIADAQRRAQHAANARRRAGVK